MKMIAPELEVESDGGEWLNLVRRQVGSLEYGVVQIVVHGSRVVQIERTEKVRLGNPIAISKRQD